MKKAAWLFSSLLAALPAAAQTWTGAGADNNWSTGANWSGGAAPASAPSTRLTFSGPTSRVSPVVDVPWTVNQLDFQSWYTLSGQPITMDGPSARISESFGETSIRNPIVLMVATTISSTNGTAILNGPISGPGALSFAGDGGALLSGTETFTGGITVASHVAFAGAMPGPVRVVAPGTFGGSGTITGPVVVNGGFLFSDAPLSTGGLTVAPGAGLVEFINGTGPGQSGNLSVTGAVDVAGAGLSLTGLYQPRQGDVFTVVTNDGVDPIAGTFAFLPEGAVIVFKGARLQISYVGGTGNDITLTVIAAAVTPESVPTLSEWALILLAAIVAGIGMMHPAARSARKRE